MQVASRYAICLSGGLRTFDEVKHNFELALVAPSSADVFAHVYTDPSSEAHQRAVHWLQKKPWLRKLVVEVFNESVKEDIVRSIPSFPSIRAAKGSALSMLSMLRKMKLANDLRRDFEGLNGVRYSIVVRVRPDLAFGNKWQLDLLPLRSSVKGGLIFTPLPPIGPGSIWRVCRAHDPFRRTCCAKRKRCCKTLSAPIPESEDGQCDAHSNSSSCVPSPLLPHLGFYVDCPCCSIERNAAKGHMVCGCNKFQSVVFDQVAIGNSLGMDAYSSLYDRVEELWNTNHTRVVFKSGFVTERLLKILLLKQHVRLHVTSALQWGVRREVGVILGVQPKRP